MPRADLGSDFAGFRDVNSHLSTHSGRPQLAHALMRRLLTRRGGLAAIGGDPTYGYDLSELIGSSPNLSDVEARVTEQMVADERVLDCIVTATYSAQTSTLSIVIIVTDDDGPFELVATVGAIDVDLYFSEAA